MTAWLYCLCCNFVFWLLSLLCLNPSSSGILEGKVSPTSLPRIKPSYSFGRAFLGLDKCNACIGTSICKKFFKEEIRFDSWLSSHLKLPPNYLLCYSGNYTDDTKSWRPVEISRLMTKYQHDQSDKRICTSLTFAKSCSIERALWKTERFQKWLKAKRLTLDLVQGLPTPLLRCPSQRLLDRIVRRYAEVPDAGSILMDHFSDRDKLRLLYTLSVNTHPIILQIFPEAEGWPFPKYLGSCGRLIVTTSTRPLKEFYSVSPDVAADLALQLLAIIDSMMNNDLNYYFYFTHVDADTFGVFTNGYLFIRDASRLGIIDMQEGTALMEDQQAHNDIFSCLAVDCQSVLPSCNSIKHTQNLFMVCEEVLPKLLKDKFLPSIQDEIDSALAICADSFLAQQKVISGAQKLAEILKPLQPCHSHFAYRYPDCKYNTK
ncbi:divergent protein kinase domain 2B [Heteronotia binoei]|uniref:divergent protein kinase domain 2B n=1 Tax=Heteronotia binoei TaxID=13085 RepID=UPI00292CABF5|nr:divergent protein kinase domain 2B [Heteronotia binoei]